MAAEGGRLLLRVEGEEKIKDLMKVVLEQGGTLHSLTPRTATLEDLFVDLVRQG